MKDVMDEVKAKFKSMGMEMVTRPVHSVGKLIGQRVEPSLPSDLTVLNDIELGGLFTEFCCMAQYAQLRMAVRGVEKAAARAAEKYARASARLRKEGTVQDKEAQVETDDEVVAKSSALLAAEGVDALTYAMHASYLIGRDACSREMSRRQWSENGSGNGNRR